MHEVPVSSAPSIERPVLLVSDSDVGRLTIIAPPGAGRAGCHGAVHNAVTEDCGRAHHLNTVSNDILGGC